MEVAIKAMYDLEEITKIAYEGIPFLSQFSSYVYK